MRGLRKRWWVWQYRRHEAYRRRHCQHGLTRGIYGDEIIAAGYKRLRCLICGRLLDGPVTDATVK